MKINPNKSKAIRFTRARTKDTLQSSLSGMLVPEENSCKYLGIILSIDLSWANKVNCTVKKAWKALPFIIWLLRKGTSNTKRLGYM